MILAISNGIKRHPLIVLSRYKTPLLFSIRIRSFSLNLDAKNNFTFIISDKKYLTHDGVPMSKIYKL